MGKNKAPDGKQDAKAKVSQIPELDVVLLNEEVIELQRANQQLEELAKFPQENPSPVIRVGKNGDILYANAACSKLESFKCQAGQILPKRYQKIVTEILRTGSPQTVELEEEQRIFSLYVVPVIKSGYVNIYGQDITERKKAEDALKESEERFRALSETSPVGIGVVSPDGIILYANPSYELILGYRRGDVTGFKASELYLDPMDRRKWLDTMKDKGVVRYFESRLKRKDGSLVWVSISASPILFESKQAIMGTIQDITERKQTEESLRKYTLELEAVNKELESFSYSASHDLRAPLRTLDGFSEILIQDYRDKLDETGKDYLNRIRKASQNMSQLIDDMAKLSRITQAEISLQEVNLSEMVGSILNELKEAQPERKVDFVIAPQTKAIADRQLTSILMRNLLENAWKFTSKCSQTKIEFGVRDQDSKRVYFIEDNGVGFDMKYADRLFKPFQRLHSQKEYTGTGIGLAIIQRVILRHGGRVWAESEVGKGSTFYFTLS